MNENEARDKLQGILDDKEYRIYHNESQGMLSSLWDKAKEWIAEQLEKIFPSLTPTSGMASTTLIILLVIVAAILLIVVALGIRNGIRKKKFLGSKPIRSENEMLWSYEKHLEEAAKNEELQQYSKAIRHMFLALLLYFHDKEWLEAKIWKTNWDYYEELRKIDPQGAEKFYRFALLFDEVAYGEREVRKTEYVEYKQEAMNWLRHEKGTLSNVN